MSDKILLEAGTNEMELLVFNVGGVAFGVNVAKVKEMVPRTETVRIPKSPEVVEGSFMLREEVVTLVNLGKYLKLESETSDEDQQLIIVVEFSSMVCGVLVDSIEIIHRLSWQDFQPPPDYLAKSGIPLTAIALVDDRVVQVLDFESILGEILNLAGANVEATQSANGESEFGETRVLIADDSRVIRESVSQVLRNAGFANLTVCTDGQHAWDTIEASRQPGTLPFDIVLSDIEMPRMDGLHLTYRIKKDAELQKIPVILFSSLIREETANKGKQVGADAQITKFEGDELILAVKDLLASR